MPRTAPRAVFKLPEVFMNLNPKQMIALVEAIFYGVAHTTIKHRWLEDLRLICKDDSVSNLVIDMPVAKLDLVIGLYLGSFRGLEAHMVALMYECATDTADSCDFHTPAQAKAFLDTLDNTHGPWFDEELKKAKGDYQIRNVLNNDRKIKEAVQLLQQSGYEIVKPKKPKARKLDLPTED